MVSLKDISVRCGVSVATVSKALNGHKDVSEATRERLMKAAKEMGYFPNSQARALKTNRTYNLGVMYLDEAGSGLTHEFFAKVLDSFKTTAEAAGYDITFINRDVGKQKMSTYEHCKYRNVDGVIIACTDFTSQDVYEVINGDIPVVTIDHIFDCRTAIMSNNEKGMEELINYVTKMGHRKIAFIQGNRSAVAERRLAGFYKACMTRGISVDPDWILNGDYPAMGAFNAVKEMGLSVPEDISIVGYDGIAYSQLLSPKLTTYLQDTDLIGVTAAKQLVSLIENPQTTFKEVITVDGKLLEGGSVSGIN